MKINVVKLLIAASALLPAFAAAAENEAPKVGGKMELAALYYPHWHVYPRGEEWFGKGWTEWEFVKNAKPRFKHHKYAGRICMFCKSAACSRTEFRGNTKK